MKCPVLLLGLVSFTCAVTAQPHFHPPQAIPPHLHQAIPKSFVRGDTRDGVNDMATMTAIVNSQSAHHLDVTVKWSGVGYRQLSDFDWIAVFDRHDLTQFHAPIKYKYVFSHGLKNLTTSGSMQLTLQNYRSYYVFMYITGNQQFPEIVAQSQEISFGLDAKRPMNYHIALAPSDSNHMLVMWNQKEPKHPTLKWGLSPNLNLRSAHVVNASADTYKKTDFCDTQTAPAGRHGWFEPGLFLTAKLPVSPGTTYFYVVGDSEDGWSKVLNFTTAPAAKDGPTRLIILADLGNAPSDGSLQHSWDFHNHGEEPSRNTTALAKRVLDQQGAAAVVHVGDIAYAVGYLSEWDAFMTQIEPVASKVPWMASIGNHEMGWSASDFTTNGTLGTSSDSGGECGVAFLKRFPYAMQPLRAGMQPRQAEPWYSFDVGLVHFTMLSSEHDFTTGSRQWRWMVNDLSRVDRSATPWLVVTSHRPMYIASSYAGDGDVGKMLRTHVEPQLLKYGVDFFLSGHHHSYQRFCKVNNGTCNDNNGVRHYVLGMAGYEHSDVGKGIPIAKFTDATMWGLTYWEVTQTTAKIQYIDAATEKVVDEVTVSKAEANVQSIVI